MAVEVSDEYLVKMRRILGDFLPRSLVNDMDDKMVMALHYIILQQAIENRWIVADANFVDQVRKHLMENPELQRK